jgi:hypothetical protein
VQISTGMKPFRGARRGRIPSQSAGSAC